VKKGFLYFSYLLTEVPDLLDLESCLKETPLHISVANGHIGIVERFLQGPLKDSLRRAMHRDINGTSSIMAAVARSDNDMALWLLRRFGRQLAMQPNNYGMLPLHVAAAKGMLELTYNPISQLGGGVESPLPESQNETHPLKNLGATTQ
jgi:ankyrin repeat protein